MSQQSAEKRMLLIKRKAYKDLFFFSKYVLGRNLMEEQPHKELCDVLMALAQKMFADIEFNITTQWVLDYMDDTEELLRKALIMLPRGSFKSTIVSNAFPVWLLWHDPNLRIMIDTETLGNSKLYLAGIKDMMVNNDLVRWVCEDDDGNFMLEPNLDIPGGFNEDSVILKQRTRLGAKEPTIFCSGVDNARTGMHPDVIIFDDLVSERNVKTPEQILKTKDHYRFALSLLEPTGICVVVGTRYHTDDLYAELYGDQSFVTLVRPAIAEDGTLYFPSRLTREFLDEQKRSQGSYIFASQYQLDPIADDTTPFNDIDIMRYKPGKAPTFTKKFMTVDLAISERETSDDRVVTCIGATGTQDCYVIDYIHGIFTPMKHIDYIFQLSEKYGIVDVGIEVVAYQKAFIYMLEAEMRRRGKHLRIRELKARGSKMERAMAFQPYVEQHKFYVQDTHKTLIEQMTKFPYAKHDDIVDTITYIPQMLSPYQAKAPKKKPAVKRSSVTGY